MRQHMAISGSIRAFLPDMGQLLGAPVKVRFSFRVFPIASGPATSFGAF